MQDIRAIVNVDGTGFFRGIGQMSKRLGEFKVEAAATLGTAEAGAGLVSGLGAVLGAGLLAKMISNVNNFGQEVLEASEKFHLSTDAVQRLRFAAEMSGKDMGYLEKVFNNLDTRQMDLVKSALESPHPAQAIGEVLPEIGGRAGRQRNLVQLMENLQALGDIPVMTEDEVRKLAMSQQQLKAMAQALSVSTGPIVNAIDELILAVAFYLRAATSFVKAEFQDIFGFVTGGDTTHTDQMFARFNAEHALLDKLMSEGAPKLGDENITIGKSPLGELQTSQFARIGGLQGINTDYRIQRLTEQIEKNTAQTAKNTQPKAGKNTGIKDSPIPLTPRTTGIADINTFTF